MNERGRTIERELQDMVKVARMGGITDTKAASEHMSNRREYWLWKMLGCLAFAWAVVLSVWFGLVVLLS